MYIITGVDNATDLRQKYTVLELETFDQGPDSPITAFCVLPPEAISLTEMPDLERLCRLHQALIDAWNDKNYATVMEILPHVETKFGGELDSFYKVIATRLENDNQ